MRIRFMLRAVVGAAFAALLFVVVACDDPNAPGGNKSKPVDPEPKPEPVSYVGTVKATVDTRMQATLRIADDGAFALSTLTAPSAASSSVRRLQTATTTSTAPVLIALAGTSTDDGTTATLQVDSAQRDGEALEGAELDKYRACPIAGTIGAGFHAEVLAAAASCVLAEVAPGGDTTVSAADVAVAPVPADVKPIDALIGKWGGLLPVSGAVLWEFAEGGLKWTFYSTEGREEFEFAGVVVTAEAVVDVTFTGRKFCHGAGDCEPITFQYTDEQLAKSNAFFRETLPWSYFLTDVLTVAQTFLTDGGGFVWLELRRDDEPAAAAVVAE